MSTIKPIEWKNDTVILLDQRKLPSEEVYITYEDYQAVADAIRNMVVRGAPAIGVATAMGIALGAQGIGVPDYFSFAERLRAICETFRATRPTAVNLQWAIDRMMTVLDAHQGDNISDIIAALKTEALRIYDEDLTTNQRIGEHGSAVIVDGDHVLTHCNAGILATAGYGTALSCLYTAHAQGKEFRVFVDETRPLLQGARLSAWELAKMGITPTVICDNMAASLMQHGQIDKIIVGADRIAANGDTANKIGTYSLAVLADYHHVPLYVAAPRSTIDMQCATGKDIPIEQRGHDEISHVGNTQLAPQNAEFYNPAFDVTPADLIAGIITDAGIAHAPFDEGLSELF